MLREILEAAGAQVSTAACAMDALDLLERERPEVLIADIGMPRMDGFELIAMIRQHKDVTLRTVPAAALTAYARSQDRAKALQSGFQMHLAKPIDPTELMAAVAYLAGRSHASR
jgi:CheY-like chemotaxis protein